MAIGLTLPQLAAIITLCIMLPILSIIVHGTYRDWRKKIKQRDVEKQDDSQEMHVREEPGRDDTSSG